MKYLNHKLNSCRNTNFWKVFLTLFNITLGKIMFPVLLFQCIKNYTSLHSERNLLRINSTYFMFSKAVCNSDCIR
jgi:hypothetical protein